ncbi:MAG: hypothetical protein IJH75_02115 [Mogibacterium sp.]|nr:hypothetical protein [Mogibacterium sp.]
MLPYRYFKHNWKSILVASGAVIGAVLLEVISEASNVKMPDPEDLREEDLEILSDIEELGDLLRADGAEAAEIKEE